MHLINCHTFIPFDRVPKNGTVFLSSGWMVSGPCSVVLNDNYHNGPDVLFSLATKRIGVVTEFRSRGILLIERLHGFGR